MEKRPFFARLGHLLEPPNDPWGFPGTAKQTQKEKRKPLTLSHFISMYCRPNICLQHKKNSNEGHFCPFLPCFGALKSPVRLPRIIQNGPKWKAKPPTLSHFISMYSWTYLWLLSCKNRKKYHFLLVKGLVLQNFGASKWPISCHRLIQTGPKLKAKPLTLLNFFPMHCRTYLWLQNRKCSNKGHFCPFLALFWSPQVACKASQARPKWPKVKGKATDIITLHFDTLQNLPLTAE